MIEGKIIYKSDIFIRLKKVKKLIKNITNYVVDYG